LETRDGEVAGSVLAVPPNDDILTLVRSHRDGELLRLVFKGGLEDTSFEGRIPARIEEVILGSYCEGKNISHARLARTQQKELTNADITLHQPVPEPLQKIQNMSRETQTLALQVFKSSDPAEKQKLVKQIAEIRKAVQEQRPKAYEEVVTRHADSAAVFEAALSLLSTAGARGAERRQVESWAATVTRAAEPYGRRWRQEISLRVAELLGASPVHGQLALPYAQRAADLLRADDGTFQTVRTFQALAAALQRAGKPAEARQVEIRLAELDDTLDKEYRARRPALKVTATDGTNKKGNRAAVLEFFTGIHCPYSESLYLAFDALRQNYTGGDLVIIQYHTPLSGPDPMANADTESRWKYYVKANPKQVQRTPATFFNGRLETLGRRHGHAKKPADRSDDARRKYNLSTEIIDETLATSAVAKLSVRAERRDEKITISVDVRDLAAPAETMRLRLALVEDTIRYVGTNNLRFHHHVVRAMPGGPDGVSLKEGDSSHQVTVDLADLRERAHRYLDDYATQRKVLPALYRPLELERLHIIAFVQDDSSSEILIGAMAEVTRGP
jgi:hypothetical protein